MVFRSKSEGTPTEVRKRTYSQERTPVPPWRSGSGGYSAAACPGELRQANEIWLVEVMVGLICKVLPFTPYTVSVRWPPLSA